MFECIVCVDFVLNELSMSATPSGEEVVTRRGSRNTESEFAEQRNNGSAARRSQVRPTFITNLTAGRLAEQVCSGDRALEALDESLLTLLPRVVVCPTLPLVN